MSKDNCGHCENGSCKLLKLNGKMVPCKVIPENLCKFEDKSKFERLKKWDEQLSKQIEYEKSHRPTYTPSNYRTVDPMYDLIERNDKRQRGYDPVSGCIYETNNGLYITKENYDAAREPLGGWGCEDDECRNGCAHYR